MDNHLYNLMIQAVQEQKSLWRIKKFYMEESSSEEEKVFWKRTMEDKENHVKDLLDLVKKCLP
jgi:hypothetical protein